MIIAVLQPLPIPGLGELRTLKCQKFHLNQVLGIFERRFLCHTERVAPPPSSVVINIPIVISVHFSDVIFIQGKGKGCISADPAPPKKV